MNKSKENPDTDFDFLGDHGLPIDDGDRVTSFEADGQALHQTLSLGKKLLYQDGDITVCEPVGYLRVPGEHFKLGDLVTRDKLPPGTVALKCPSSLR